MPDEIEAKARVEDLGPVRERLEAEGGRRGESGLEHNVVFDAPDRRLRSSDSLLRLRRYAGRAILTYKGPRAARGAVKSRQETEVEVSDFDAAAAIIAALGFERAWTYEKRRETWTLGSAKVVLDEVPCLGSFVEVEADDERAVLEALDRLAVPRGAIVPQTYLELFADYSRRAGRAMTDMVFDKEAR